MPAARNGIQMQVERNNYVRFIFLPLKLQVAPFTFKLLLFLRCSGQIHSLGIRMNETTHASINDMQTRSYFQSWFLGINPSFLFQ